MKTTFFKPQQFIAILVFAVFVLLPIHSNEFSEDIGVFAEAIIQPEHMQKGTPKPESRDASESSEAEETHTYPAPVNNSSKQTESQAETSPSDSDDIPESNNKKEQEIPMQEPSLQEPSRSFEPDEHTSGAAETHEQMPVDQSPEFEASEPAGKDIVNPYRIYSYNQMTEDIQKLAEAYPDLIEYRSIGKTRYGRDIWAVRLGKSDVNVLYNGAHHGREWLTTSLLMYMLEQYAQAYVNNDMIGEYSVRSLLDEISIWMIPMVNPDGVTLAQFGPDAFPPEVYEDLIAMNDGSNDFDRWKANGYGIDLNRQYPADFENIRNNRPGPWFENYTGAEPLITEEAIAMVNFTNAVMPQITLSYHSAGEVLYWHFHNNPEFVERDRNIAEGFSELTGYYMLPPEPNPSGGGYKDWFIITFDRPGLTAEIGKYIGDRSLPIEQFDDIWESNRVAGLYLADQGRILWKKQKEEANIAPSVGPNSPATAASTAS